MKKKVTRPPKISHTKKPASMTLEQWQRALRAQIAASQRFTCKNTGSHPVYSEFRVKNLDSGGLYKVAIRGDHPGDNFCSCPDFSINTLGTCKHVEFLLAKFRKSRALKMHLRKPYFPKTSEIFVHYGEQREVRLNPGAAHSPEMAQWAKSCFDKSGVMKPSGLHGIHGFIQKALAAGGKIKIYDDALEFIAGMQDAEKRQAVIETKYRKKNHSSLRKGVIPGVHAKLYPYQVEGALFAAARGRCIIADEMGLGKTIQAIGAAVILKQEFGIEKVLVVCPASVKYQWSDEIKKFSGLPSQVVDGPIPRRRRSYPLPVFFLIAGYEQVLRDIDAVNAAGFDLVVLDETQRIKNWKTKTSKSIKRLEMPFAIAMTGTPLENRLEELHSIVSFIDRYRLGPLFKFIHSHQITDDHGKCIGYKDLSHVGKSIAPILIRRTKKEVQSQLPERIQKNLFVPLTPEQREMHEEFGATVAQIAARWKRQHFLSEADQRRLMIALQNMRMACDSTYLIDQERDFGTKVEELSHLLEDALSIKGQKAIIFSQWTRMHELVSARLEREGIGHVFLHGGVAVSKRGGLVKQFREDPATRVFLSTDAGGTGLNLQNASCVINLDLPWNPAVLDQRIGRVHRIGQRLPVHVFNLVAEHTIEHGMLQVLSFKKAIFAGVLDGGKDTVMMGDTRLNRFMKEISEVTQSHESREAPSPAEPASPAGSGSRSAGLPDLNAGLLGLIRVGADFLTGLKQQLETNTPKTASSGRLSKLVETDSTTGRPCLKIPLPDQNVLGPILSALGPLLAGVMAKITENNDQA